MLSISGVSRLAEGHRLGPLSRRDRIEPVLRASGGLQRPVPVLSRTRRPCSEPRPISRRLPATFHMKTQERAPFGETLR